MLVETLVFRHESAQDFCSDSLILMILMIRMSQQMRGVDDEKSISEGVAEAHELIARPRGNYAVRIPQCLGQHLRLFRR